MQLISLNWILVRFILKSKVPKQWKGTNKKMFGKFQKSLKVRVGFWFHLKTQNFINTLIIICLCKYFSQTATHIFLHPIFSYNIIEHLKLTSSTWEKMDRQGHLCFLPSNLIYLCLINYCFGFHFVLAH